MTNHPFKHQILCKILREKRLRRGLNQQQLAKRLNKPQSFVSKYESGERRLDLVELREICQALKLPLKNIVELFEKKI